VYEPGDDVLADAAFAGNQNLGVRSSGALDLLLELTECPACSYEFIVHGL
jgi:hypothetical protein